MTSAQAAGASPRPKRGRDWRRAGRALRALIADPERTESVFDLIDALDQETDERWMREFKAHPEGLRLLEDRPDLLAALGDHSVLASMPEGSLGRCYLDFVRAGGITAEGLVEADEAREQYAGAALDSDLDYLNKRGRDCHDLWHVLTGYGTDEAGEVSVLAFTYGQYPSLGILLIVLAGGVIGSSKSGLGWPRYLWRAYRRGKRADLDNARYEDWLALPLDEARRLARIEPPEQVHPGGVIRVRLDPDTRKPVAV